MRKWVLFLLILYINTGSIRAGNGTSGFEFLRTEFSSRAASMGRAFVAMRGDINGLYHNPSGMAYFDQNQFVVNYTDYLIDFGGGFAAYSHRLPGLGQLSGSIIWLNYGDFEETNEFAQKSGRTYGAYDLAFALSYADILEQYFSYGVTLKYIHSKIDMFTADAIAFDFGLMYAAPFEDNLYFGLSLLNVGRPLSAFVET
ncbi:MAG: PorV/PorQ family protein [Calditrichia bacterium]